MHLYTIAHALKIQCHMHAIVGDQAAMTDTHLFNYNDEGLHKHARLLGIKITINFLLRYSNLNLFNSLKLTHTSLYSHAQSSLKI